jgi:hypothetical protein
LRRICLYTNRGTCLYTMKSLRKAEDPVGTLSDVPRPATGKTPVRNFRIRDAIYAPARRIAKVRGDSLTAIVEKALAAYVKRYRADDPGDEGDA